LSEEEKNRLSKKNEEQEARIRELEEELERAIKEAGNMKHAIWAFAMVICIAFIVVVFALIGHESNSVPPGVSRLDSKPPLGDDCANPIKWSAALDHVGKTIALRGPIVEISRASRASGDPTFINIGASFPDSSRLTAVIWGRNLEGFADFLEHDPVGQVVCVTGTVKKYRGAAEVELRSRSQLRQTVLDRYPTSYPGEYPGDQHG
ncbi:MAG: OB-fold nucleic acid binding domain-containing protein, partial [Xanthomonadales bacterium]|nr:OB-fold nucleic acid binding domain-containing protein [Xanthomonadales bacterium]